MTEQERDELRRRVNDYCRALHTQTAEDFLPLWAEGVENVLISLSNCYVGTEAIYRDFLVGRIHAAYSRIDLIVHGVEIRRAAPDTAVVVFRYATDCIRRETGEPHGIKGLETQVWVRQRGAWKLCHVQYAMDA